MRIQYLLSTLTLFQSGFAKDPGLPMENPNVSYWQLPPNPDVADRQSPKLPNDVDVVIIGSGVSGTSVAHWLLHDGSQSQPLRIAIVEARQSCSGASGRNGGQVRPTSWDYIKDKAQVGKVDAKKIVRLRAKQFSEYLKVAEECLDAEGRDAAEVRAIDSIDAWFDDESYETAVKELEILKREVPDVGDEWTAFPKKEAREKTLMPGVVGIFAGTPKTGGALWPYRFVSHLQSSLLKKFPSLSLDTHTPVLNITASTKDGNGKFEVETTRGTIQTRHVVHAGGAWTTHLLRKLDDNISQARWHMTTQAVGDKIPDAGKWPPLYKNGSFPGGRAWGLWRDYYGSWLQQPKTGLFIGGGGIAGQGDDVPAWDDRTPVEPIIGAYLNGVLPTFFGYNNWGAERTAVAPQKNVYPGRSKRSWTGVEAISWDNYPIVGPLPTSITGREIKNGTEWIITGYNGDGMPAVWKCAQALSTAMLSAGEARKELQWPEWFPKSWTVSEQRLRNNRTNTSESSGKLKRSRWN